MGSIRHIGRQLNASIDRARVEHESIRLRPRHPLSIQAKETRVLSDRREEPVILTLGLYSEHIKDVNFRNDLIQIMTNLHPHLR